MPGGDYGDFSSNINDIVRENQNFASRYEGLPHVPPTRKLAVVACMDSRVDVATMFGLKLGEANVIRNAGGVITDDTIRSLYLSQRYLRTREIIIMHHTDCGLQGLDEPSIRREIEAETGIRPAWSLDTFDDPYDDVRQSMRRIEMSPFIRHKKYISGYVYDVASGLLTPVERKTQHIAQQTPTDQTERVASDNDNR